LIFGSSGVNGRLQIVQQVDRFGISSINSMAAAEHGNFPGIPESSMSP
jgi:hypothetical protein